MKGSAIFLLAALATTSNPGPAVDDRPEPGPIERWFDGAAKETQSALDAWADEDYEQAQQRLDRAYQITPEDPRAKFNAGTGRLAVGDLETAATLLEDSPAGSQPEELQLAADAAFNLGTGFHQAGDLERAIAAYEAALRRDSDHADAKFNLELALRQQQEQQEQEQESEDQEPNQNQEEKQEDQDQGQGQEPEQEQSNSEDPAASDSESKGENAPQPDPPPDPTESPQTPPPSEDGQPQPQPPSRLPSFEDQEDMTADQAAALLEAVENLEQEQRAEMAEEARAQRAIDLQVEKDW